MTECKCSQSEHQEAKVMAKKSWMTGYKTFKGKEIPVISTKLDTSDILGDIFVRWGINRMSYAIDPGLYCVGNPDETSPVLVTANYKLTVDQFRKELDGVDAWVVILDTKGINVWCAAGKGTFGTEELIKRIEAVDLKGIINHNKIILPQLGAVGVSAHKVKKESGFNVIYGPVRACDIKKFLSNNLVKDREMSRVNFNITDRLAVTPVELVLTWKLALPILAVLAIFDLIINRTISLKTFYDFMPFLGAILVGCVAVPALLPWIPSRAFSVKGLIMGTIWTLLIGILYKLSFIQFLSVYLMVTPLAAFLAMNFTGATTFTSQTGTILEVRRSLPLMIGAVLTGLVLKVILDFHLI